MSIRIISGGKCSGKTTKLIKIAAETDEYIVVARREEARSVADFAAEIGFNIRYPISVCEAVRGNLIGTPYARFHKPNGVLIDGADKILANYLHVPRISAMTVSDGEVDELEAFLPLREENEKLRKLCAELYGELVEASYEPTYEEETYLPKLEELRIEVDKC